MLYITRLATPFDIYETLRDVLDIHRPETPVTFKERGISLLKEIPINRTCASAGLLKLKVDQFSFKCVDRRFLARLGYIPMSLYNHDS